MPFLFIQTMKSDSILDKNSILTHIPAKLYSWIGRPVQAHKKLICRETKRATADLNIPI